MNLAGKILKILTNPSIAFKHIWRKVPVGSIELRSRFDAVEKPSYAYGILKAAKLARALGVRKISVVEFGVSKGGGLLAMERISEEVESATGVDIEVYGFDSAAGLTRFVDYRDIPYVWNEGEFKMDVEALKKKLKRAHLVLGDVKDTVQKEMKNFSGAPIGFVSFDLDLYSSTKSAFKIFDGETKTFLPRVSCYFDDVYDIEADYNEFTGELLAIKEFNDEHPNSKIAKSAGLAAMWNLRSSWTEGMYVLHNFTHPQYNQNVHRNS